MAKTSFIKLNDPTSYSKYETNTFVLVLPVIGTHLLALE